MTRDTQLISFTPLDGVVFSSCEFPCCCQLCEMFWDGRGQPRGVFTWTQGQFTAGKATAKTAALTQHETMLRQVSESWRQWSRRTKQHNTQHTTRQPSSSPQSLHTRTPPRITSVESPPRIHSHFEHVFQNAVSEVATQDGQAPNLAWGLCACV